MIWKNQPMDIMVIINKRIEKRGGFLKIMYVITLGTWGGAQSHLFSLIKDQVGRKNDVWLVFGKKGELIEKIKNNFPEVHMIFLPSLTRQFKFSNLIKASFELRKIINKIDPNIIHLHSTMSGIVGRLSLLFSYKKAIFTVHGWIFTPGVSRFRKYIGIIIEKLLKFKTKKYICVSDFDYSLGFSSHVFTNRKQATVIKNGVMDRPIKQKGKIDKNVFEIVMAARFNEQKNQELLINSVIKLNNPNIHVSFLGDGPSLKVCKSKINKLNLAKQFSFKGRVDNVLPYYQNADVVALISNYEGLPISLVEALQVGKPIIASNVGGNSELFNQNGFCVENNEEKISRAIDILINSEELRIKMGNLSRKMFLEAFSEKIMVDKINKLYSEEKYN